MSRLGLTEMIVVAAWLGAAVLTAAVVAPAAFRVLPSRTLAGAVVGQVLPVIFVSGLIVAILAGIMEARGGRSGTLVMLGFVTMVVACIVAQFVIGPKIEAVRTAIGGAVDALDESDPRRVQFGQLHGLSVLCMGVAMLGAGSSLVAKLLQSKS